MSLIFTIIILFRIRDEEAMLSHEFGVEWKAYRNKTRRLIPFIF